MSVYLEYRSPSEILDRKNEWREECPKQLELMRRFVREHGVVEPPLIDASNRIVCGSLTVKVAREIGLNSIPVLRADHMSDDELRLYAVRASKVASLSGYDEKVLAIELRELEVLLQLNTHLDFGFEQGELDRIFNLADLDLGSELDAVPVVEKTPLSRTGDCWLMGEHRLLCGDALDPVNYPLLMRGEKARFVFSDVPYNLSADTISGNGRFQHDDFAMAYGEYSPAEFTRFLTKAMRNMAAHSMDGSLHAFFMSYHYLLELLRAGKIVYDRPKAMCTWVKTQGGQGSLYRSQTEYIVFFRNGSGPFVNNVQNGRFGRNRTTAWHYEGMNVLSKERDELLENHPTPKPVPLLKDAILDVTNRGDIVLDPFAGSGSLILAAEATERRAFTMEIDPHYVDVTLRRVHKSLGIDPVRESDGMLFSELEAMTASGGILSEQEC